MVDELLDSESVLELEEGQMTRRMGNSLVHELTSSAVEMAEGEAWPGMGLASVVDGFSVMSG